MSFTLAPGGVRPWRFDLDAARAQWDRTNSRARWFDWAFTALLMVVQGNLQFMVWGGGRRGLVAGVIAGVIFLLLPMLGKAFDRWKERRQGGPAAAGPSSVTQVLTPATGPDVWQAVIVAVGETGFTGATLLDPHTLQAARMRTFLPSHHLTVRVEGAGDQRALVTLWVRPHATLLGEARDLGRSRRYANAVLAAIPGATGVR
ncbi:hypothetical protein GCM10022415_01310 [Knoellia locipacati]|uniref:DUF1499 domain-containing protein n=1 Tax=Knoellia locipacati TaxID=882824 RepID=A0A512SVX6_9MICO|nr:hypothetical protein [Knoellia locipacati]GEQ12084.1 hypothetical protein KLO01_01310 [Knoellia locipacati]